MAVEVARRSVTHRLRGVDAARGLALFGMMSVHLMPATDPDGTVSTAYQISSGRASALFALLAGVGLALGNGGVTPPRGPGLSGARRAVAGRAAVLLLIGLSLGELEPLPVAVILAYYAILFLVAIPVLGLGVRTLAVLAVVAALGTPVLSQLLRMDLRRPPTDNPGFDALEDPLQFMETVTVTGYYPVLTWTTYLFAGLAVGRLALGSARIATGLLIGGIGLSVTAGTVSTALLNAGGRAAIEAAGPGNAWFAGMPLDIALQTLFYGTTPTTSWWWLAVAAPHSGTTFDLLRTTGSSLAVLGGCLLVMQHAGRIVRTALYPLAAAGSMTLTLYSVHVFAVHEGWWHDDPTRQLTIHIIAALIVATIWRIFVGRGPLEAFAAIVAQALRATASQPRRD
jgi:uncharacterized membrane protein